MNLKKDSSNGKKLPNSSPITMEYDRQAQTVRFTSTNFTYSQTGIPKDITFAVGVGLLWKPLEMDVHFIHIKWCIFVILKTKFRSFLDRN